MIDTQWQTYYDNIKDESWPPCPNIEDIIKLPVHIQLEIIKVYLFENRYERLRSGTAHIDTNISNFLHYMNNIRTLIGYSNCLMSNSDAMLLYSILLSKRPKNVLEIGRYHGWSTSVLYGALEDNNCGHLYSVDLNNFISGELIHIMQDRVTLIDQSSENLLDIDEIKHLKFEVIVIDGDHSYDMVLNDLTQSVELASPECCFLMHDIDAESVDSAINTFIKSRNDIVDCGVYGEKIKLLYKKAMP